MLKIIAYVLVPVVAFAATLVVCLALSGNLSKEGIQKLVSSPTAETSAETAPANEIDPLVKALQTREEDLNKRETQVREDEERVKKEQADLEALRTELQALQVKIGAAVKTEDAAQEKRIEDVALSLAKMKPKNAADTLSAWTVDDAAAVLRKVKDKDRGKILNEMTPEKASAVLLELQSPRL